MQFVFAFLISNAKTPDTTHLPNVYLIISNVLRVVSCIQTHLPNVYLIFQPQTFFEPPYLNMSGRSLRRRSEPESQKTPGNAKVTTVSPSVSAKREPARKKRVVDGEADFDPWLENSDWARLFNPTTVSAIKGSRTREEWEIKVVVGISELFLHCRHVPSHRIPEVLGVLQPMAPGVVHAASERPFFEKKMKELQTELSFLYETVCKILLKTPVGEEYLESFRKSKYVVIPETISIYRC